MTGPVLCCYDGSDGSGFAMRTAGALVRQPVDVVVLTVWQSLATRLTRSGSFTAFTLDDESELDSQEESNALAIAEQGAEVARGHGYSATARAAQAGTGVAPAILAVADEIDARLIVCGQRGRGLLGSALLGSVSHALSAQARRPVLIAPEHAHPDRDA